jgi:response regulator RpfG family c-di-GMP phosphodiesterase
VFNALLSKRPYKEPLGFDDIMRLLERERGKHFDPALLDVFHRVARRVYRETQEMSDETVSRAVGVLIEKYFI